MVKLLSSCLLIFAFFLAISQARSIISTKPHQLTSLKIKTNQTANGCSYTVIFKTSCSSTTYTRDRVSLAFGDAYRNEVYAQRLDNPSSGTFERCSTDTFQINGPCTYQICYLYLYRTGSDGWKPETVNINGPNIKPVTFYYNTFLPNGVWYGFNQCNRGLVSAVV
ncbi:embryo-specific protein ATS3A-like [Actinidia eriantha]|uniref:embryo-specific protein ATS3A-like n=1 Tax=Actinidia eriantha TaxID=165200 RepID=UPI002582B878|nr:embryo-specific protein ATS3A-like [Actinidia eriantha]